jgi:hypothetical protein
MEWIADTIIATKGTKDFYQCGWRKEEINHEGHEEKRRDRDCFSHTSHPSFLHPHRTILTPSLIKDQ